MNNLVLITSVICIENKPLSYSDTRSVFSHEKRFEQIKKTIQTVREKIPNSKIFIVECSNLSSDMTEYLVKNSDIFLNLYDDVEVRKNTTGLSKSLGEGTLTMCAINYIQTNNIEYDNLFKITGRYWLSEYFNYSNFDNEDIIITDADKNISNTCTILYKLHKKNVDDFMICLKRNIPAMNECVAYEKIFAVYLKEPKPNTVVNLNKIGVSGYIAVCNSFIDV